MIKTFVLTVLVVGLGASTAFPETQTVRDLGKCGSIAKNSFGSHKEYPAINETNGYVGFQTEDVDASGTKERYTLVNCATRKLVQLNAEYLLTDSSKGLPPQGDMFAFVESLRKAKKLANEALFSTNAKNRGYEITSGQLSEKYSEKAKRGDCGCQLYYPETM
jgi:hypothetical protein